MRKFALILFGLMFCIAGYSQISYPVTANLQVIPPNSVYLSDYATPGTEKMIATFILNDLNEPYYNIKFRLTIEGVGISIFSNPSFHPAPVTIQAGLPARVSGSSLAPYMDPENLIFQGISKQQFMRTGTLPEGMYKFSIQAFDYQRNIPVSNKASINVWLVLNDPPRINTPSCNSRVRIIYPQNMVFQWMPMHASSPNAANNTDYHFRLVHIIPAGRNPNDAMLSSPSIFETVISNNILYYGFSEPQLIPGEQYAWRVQAKDKSGKDIFKNNGYSEVCMFTYGEPCLPPKNLRAQVINPERVRVSWDNLQGPSGFSVRYKEKNNPAAHWYENSSHSFFSDISGIKPGIVYEYQVKSKCDPLESDYCAPDTFSTSLPTGGTNRECGSNPLPAEIDKTTKLQSLRPNDVITVDGFRVRISECTGSNGKFSGRGIAFIPFLQLNVKMSFQNIIINENYEVYEGKIIADRSNIEKYRSLVPVPGGRDICLDYKEEKGKENSETGTKNNTTANTATEVLFITINNSLVIQEGDTIIVNGTELVVDKNTKINEGDVVTAKGITVTVTSVSSGTISSSDIISSNSPAGNLITDIIRQIKDSLTTRLLELKSTDQLMTSIDNFNGFTIQGSDIYEPNTLNNEWQVVRESELKNDPELKILIEAIHKEKSKIGEISLLNKGISLADKLLNDPVASNDLMKCIKEKSLNINFQKENLSASENQLISQNVKMCFGEKLKD
ncbi:MAG: fibronectin type III domain-containing protein [Cytophagaceae bacterium]